MSVGQDQDQHRLERHAIGLPAVTAQSAALIAPAAGSVAGLVFIVGYSGAATPLAFLIGLLVCVCIALVIGEYARRLPSAGSFYTYLTRTFGPKTGFVTGVALFGAYLLLFPFQLDFFGNFVSSLLAASGVHIAWWVFSAALIVLSTTLGVLGVKPSLRTGLIGLGFEMLILTIFSLVIIFKGGAAGNTIQAFDPSHSLKGSGRPAHRRGLHDLRVRRLRVRDHSRRRGARATADDSPGGLAHDPGRRRLLRHRVLRRDHRLRGIRPSTSRPSPPRPPRSTRWLTGSAMAR